MTTGGRILTPPTIRRAEARDTAAVAEFKPAISMGDGAQTADPAVLGRGVCVVGGPGSRVLPVRGVRWRSPRPADGHLRVSDWGDGWFWWVQSVYVRRTIAGPACFRPYADLVRPAAGDVAGLRLYVEKDNARAQATYEQLGLKEAGYLVRECMFDRDGIT